MGKTLKSAYSTLQEVFNNIGIGAIIFNEASEIIFENSFAREHFDEGMLNEAMKNYNSSSKCDFRMERNRWYDCEFKNIKWVDESPVIMCLFKDVTYLKDAQEMPVFDLNVKKSNVELSMRQAIEDEFNEFEIHYQPIVDAVTGKIVMCEALLRWNSQNLGYIMPNEFIPMAEYWGLITSIGEYVMEQACLQCKKWNDEGNDIKVSINLSVVQLLQGDIVDNIRTILEKTEVNPNNIVLEITESLAISDIKRMSGIINDIKSLGVMMALDDFGTGYSSLNYIKQLSLDIIKLDRTFIEDVDSDDYEQAFVKLVVELSNSIGVKVCVEGVEKESQLNILKNNKVDYIQGFLFAYPVPAEEIKFIK